MKEIKKASLSMIFFLVSFLLGAGNAYGKNARLQLSSERTAVTAGERFIVKLEIDSDMPFSRVETFLIFNKEIAGFVSADTGISGGEGRLRVNLGDPDVDGYDEEYVDDYPTKEEDDGKKKEKYELIFRAKKAGIFSLSFVDGIKVYAGKEDVMSVSSNTLELTVKNKREASKDSTLASVKVAGFQLEPDFQKSVLDYDLKVGKETDSLIIGADPSDENSSVEVEGNEALLYGNNQVKIKVTAEDGSQTVYRIHVMREKETLEQKASETEETKPLMSEVYEEENKTEESVKKVSKDGNIFIFYVIMATVTLIAVLLLLMYYLYKKNKDDLL